MSYDRTLATLHKQREAIRQQGVRALVLIGHSPTAASAQTLEFLASLEPPVTYQHLRSVQQYLRELLGCAVDVALADPRDPAVQPFLDPLAIFIL